MRWSGVSSFLLLARPPPPGRTPPPPGRGVIWSTLSFVMVVRELRNSSVAHHCAAETRRRRSGPVGSNSSLSRTTTRRARRCLASSASAFSDAVATSSGSDPERLKVSGERHVRRPTVQCKEPVDQSGEIKGFEVEATGRVESVTHDGRISPLHGRRDGILAAPSAGYSADHRQLSVQQRLIVARARRQEPGGTPRAEHHRGWRSGRVHTAARRSSGGMSNQ